MHKSILASLLSLSFFASPAAFLKDTTFISYKEFSHLSKKEIKQRFGKDDDSHRLISSYYKHKRKPLKMLWGIIPLTALGSYFATVSANATNGMGSSVGLVLAVLFLLPAAVLLIALLRSLLHRRKGYAKKLLYEELKQYFGRR